MIKRSFLYSLMFLLAQFFLLPQCLLAKETAVTQQQSKEITKYLNTVVKKKDVPGVIAAIADNNGVIAIGSAGVRNVDEKFKMLKTDVIHIGSCTKAMTSTMLATLIAEGKLNWKTTVIEIFPELKKTINPKYYNVTLWQLVSHRSGMPENARSWMAYYKEGLNQRRLSILKDNLKNPPPFKKGEFHYSNLGYLVAGCMAEKVTGATWESLMQQRIFKPLKMQSAGFGAPGKQNEINQPWGHVKCNKKWRATQYDNPEALGPAGTVHCTVEDWVKFAALQLPKHSPSILKPAMLKQLTKPTGEYAAGWGVKKTKWAKGKVFTHTGSNTTWTATVWVAPNINRVYVFVTNSSDKNTMKIRDKVLKKLIKIDQGKKKA